MPATAMRLLALPLVAICVLLTSGSAQARQYVVQPGDTLWGISNRSGVAVARLLQVNAIPNPDLIHPGQSITLPDTTPAPGVPAILTPRPAKPVLEPAAARGILVAAANHHSVRPSFILAVSWWESGWNPTIVSRDGAVGLMQVLPATAAWAGPGLLGRRVDLRNPADNAEVGAALLHRYLDEFGDPRLALAAYYQGEAATRRYGIYPSSRTYVDGIWALRNRFEATT